MVSQIGSIFQTATTDTSGSKATQNAFDGNVDTFLQLFMAQLKNQDPTQPFSTESMTQQMSMLTQTQQSIETNKKLEELIAANGNSQASALSGFINKQVSYASEEVYAGDSGAEFSFEVPDKSNVKIQISDSTGRIVYSQTGTMEAGKSTFGWDRTGNDGSVYPTGKYKISVSKQTKATDNFSALETIVKGKVSGVDFTNNGEPSLVIGTGADKVIIDLSKVAFVSESATTTTSTTGNGTASA